MLTSLGFDRIFKENAVTIQAVTENHLSELGELHQTLIGNEQTEFVARYLEKLAFTMSDWASNEKLANKLLEEWLDEILNSFEGYKRIIHNFYCMAHVLLGFHLYVIPGVKHIGQEICEEHGPIGHDALSVFRNWSKKKIAIERAIRTISDVFGPADDHHRVRDR
ncbi:hypothetical protein DPMN_192543 [Dreissena polymorpha]|uniref:Uncharacterized protein n=1 Tax=Dreissena polymorpha TaxID=45954 RepID=A0A9D3Y4W8_DREPO|nr:hypothetical protein DPMN_192543 [Dreissena polymorpha]